MRAPTRARVAVVASILVASAVVARGGADEADAIVADSRHGPLTCGDLQSLAEHALPGVVARRADENDAAWRRRLLDRLAVHVVLAGEAADRGAERDEAFERRWAEQRRGLLASAVAADAAASVAVTPAEVERYFAGHRDELSRPATITTRWILRKVPADAGEEAWRREEELLRQLRQRVQAGEPFGPLARRHSQAENAFRGGAVKTSPRGTLLAAYEEVAWSLAPGEVSEPVRLPDGAAIVLLERRDAPRPATLETARPAIERRLRAERERAATEAVAAEACGAWPPPVDADAVAAAIRSGAGSLQVGTLSLPLAALEVHPDAPWWPERLRAALQPHCLARAAELRGLDARPDVAERLRFARTGLLAARSLDARLDARAPRLPEERLRELYREHVAAFRRPERRTFELVVVPVGERGQREALAQAQALAAAWRAGDLPPAAARERWGPIDQTELAAATSPKLAAEAFAAAAGPPIGPHPLEHYVAGRSNFEVVGYVVLRVVAVSPAVDPSLAEVEARLLAHATRPERQRLVDEILAEAAAEAALVVDEAALARCPLTPRPMPQRSREVSPSVPETPPADAPADASG